MKFNYCNYIIPSFIKSTFVLSVCVLVISFVLQPVVADAQESEHMIMETNIDVSNVQVCDSRNPNFWRDSQVIENINIEEDLSCRPDMPPLVVASVKGTNNISPETLNETGLAPDAVVKENDKDGDGDPDVIKISLEIIGLNEGEHPLLNYEIAPGIEPGLWAFAPKSTGMATEGMTGSHLMRLPSPVIRVEQGDEVSIVVDNTHYLPHTVHLHGVDHPFKDDEGNGNDGVPQISEIPIMPGESRTYKVSARTAGTMAYHCHVQPDVHILMGLSGIFVIEENRANNWVQTFNVGAGKVRHRSVASKEEYDGEFDLHYQDLDKEMHELVQNTDDPTLIARLTNNSYDITERSSDYFLLNGKSFPYTLRDSQVIVDKNKKYKLRMFNIGADSVAIHTHGHKMLVTALDGVDLGSNNEYYRDVVDIHAAQRVDVDLITIDDGLHSYGEGAWLFHSHHEAQITTDGTSPGGNISMITYKSFLAEDGIPEVVGDLRQFFTKEYYEKKLDVWAPYDKFNLFGKHQENMGVSSRMNSVLIKTFFGLLGIVFGFFVSLILFKRKN